MWVDEDRDAAAVATIAIYPGVISRRSLA